MCETNMCVKGKCQVFETCERRISGDTPQPLRTPLQLAEAKVKAMQEEIIKLKAQKDVRDIPVATNDGAKKEMKDLKGGKKK